MCVVRITTVVYSKNEHRLPAHGTFPSVSIFVSTQKRLQITFSFNLSWKYFNILTIFSLRPFQGALKRYKRDKNDFENVWKRRLCAHSLCYCLYHHTSLMVKLSRSQSAAIPILFSWSYILWPFLNGTSTMLDSYRAQYSFTMTNCAHFLRTFYNSTMLIHHLLIFPVPNFFHKLLAA